MNKVLRKNKGAQSVFEVNQELENSHAFWFKNIEIEDLDTVGKMYKE